MLCPNQKRGENPSTRIILYSLHPSRPNWYADCAQEADSAAHQRCEITHTANSMTGWKQVTHPQREHVISFSSSSLNGEKFDVCSVNHSSLQM